MTKLLSLTILLSFIAIMPLSANAKTSKSKQSTVTKAATEKTQFPALCGEWDGKVETDGIELIGTLHLFPDGDNYQGSLIAQGKGGTSKHFLNGKYDESKKQFVFRDSHVELIFGQSDWKPAVMTEYLFQLSEDGRSLTGTCRQFAKQGKINLAFQKMADISPDQILQQASGSKGSVTIESIGQPTTAEAPAKPSEPNNLDDLALEARRASATYSGGADYYEQLTKDDSVARWPKTMLPIKVYITPGDDIHNYRDTYRQAIVTSFNDWVKASNYRLSWRLVNKKDDANIVCKWVARKEELPEHKHKEQGVTNFVSVLQTKANEHWIEKVEITICTSNIFTQRALKNDDVFNVSRHEVGHALGISGHSNSKTDVMYPIMSKKLQPVSMRDTGTINHLYALYTMTPWD
ncbi:MAG: matrixin family metalloprotease [Candidatus Obscuribacterales bacterium]|nr:matrixin family metalloprotease [Candidatus Obscuribacterales bacterium]